MSLWINVFKVFKEEAHYLNQLDAKCSKMRVTVTILPIYHVNFKRLYSTLSRYLNLHEEFQKEAISALYYKIKYIFKTSA